MDSLFFQHPFQWWNGLGTPERLGLIAVLLGALTVLVATWVGLRRWWRSWSHDRDESE